ncbi:MAG: hypothetical protein DRQ88_09265 [Epsilonproteobacteria bacterium]|nr:MAG: hypothetical protein DRQ88_09265 [Campylobacterota bacterium]
MGVDKRDMVGYREFNVDQLSDLIASTEISDIAELLTDIANCDLKIDDYQEFIREFLDESR